MKLIKVEVLMHITSKLAVNGHEVRLSSDVHGKEVTVMAFIATDRQKNYVSTNTDQFLHTLLDVGPFSSGNADSGK